VTHLAQRLAGRRDLQPPAVGLEELHFQRLRELLELHRDRRLREVQLLGGARHGT
jgi:hypothetical protein